MSIASFHVSHRFLLLLGVLVLILLFTDAAQAANTSGGGLPFDSWFTKIRTSITGPFAFTVSIVGLVVAGATLIFGGDMNGFMRTLIFLALVLSFVVAAQNTLSSITGQGAEISMANCLSEG
jgi:type IV secretory pathway VirB2 component (pilin)